MFIELDDFRIKVHNKELNGIFFIPNLISTHPLEDLFKSINWLVSHAKRDFWRTEKQVSKRRAAIGYNKKSKRDIDARGIRLGARTQLYVNQICLIEDILKYEFDRMKSLLKEAGWKDLTNPSKREYQELLDRLDNIRTFRNKVVAHTAYTYPKKNKETGEIEDNPETIVRSILNLFPELGGIHLGRNFFSGFSKWQSQLPVISIFDWETDVLPVLEDWKTLFIDLLVKIYQHCPVENGGFKIEAASPHKMQILVEKLTINK